MGIKHAYFSDLHGCSDFTNSMISNCDGALNREEKFQFPGLNMITNTTGNGKPRKIYLMTIPILKTHNDISF